VSLRDEWKRRSARNPNVEPREGCECDRRGLGSQDECVYDEPCSTAAADEVVRLREALEIAEIRSMTATADQWEAEAKRLREERDAEHRQRILVEESRDRLARALTTELANYDEEGRIDVDHLRAALSSLPEQAGVSE
jgi:hypothetical protein